MAKLLADGLFPALPSQGARAVRSGMFGELVLEAMFCAYKIDVVNDQPELHMPQFNWAQRDKLLIRQARISPNHYVDFLYKDYSREISLPIECKNQMGLGTTDEKLTSTVEFIVDAGCAAFWLVLTGKGWRPKVLRLVRHKIEHLNATTNLKARMFHSESQRSLQRSVELLIERGEV